MTHARVSIFCLISVVAVLWAASPSSAQTLVLVADGAGDFRCCSTMLRWAAAQVRSPVMIEPFVWSHGYRRCFADQVDTCYAQAQGRRLAAEVLARRAANPRLRICLAGHSAGCAVALAGAENLPPNSLACVVLLAPSLPSSYDLCPALPAAYGGIHVFYSRRDIGMMAAVRGVEVFKSGLPRKPAGRVGFDTPCRPCCLAERLRQYPWNPSWAKLGHDGGHYGCYQPAFVQVYLLPLFMGNP